MAEQTTTSERPVATEAGQTYTDADGKQWWAWAAGEGRFVWTNRPVGWKAPKGHAVYAAISALMTESPERKAVA